MTLLNSLPLNIVHENNKFTDREKNDDEFSQTENTTSLRFVQSENTSSYNLDVPESTTSCKIVKSNNNSSGTNIIKYTSDTKHVFAQNDTSNKAEIPKVFTNTDEAVELNSDDRHGRRSETFGDKVESNKEHVYKSDECLYAELFEKNEAQVVDENNNFQLVQKYSDISDVCASETETTVYTSSSDEEQSEPRKSTKRQRQNLNQAGSPNTRVAVQSKRIRGSKE